MSISGFYKIYKYRVIMVNKNIIVIFIYEKDKKNFGWWIFFDIGDFDVFFLLIYVSDKII